MTIEFCDKCNKILPKNLFNNKTDPCNCRIFTITDEDGDKYKARGRDLEEAAEKFAEKYDRQSEYAILESYGNGMNFFIEDSKTGKTRKIRIFADQVVEYTVEKL
jgi:hypothetical protein